MSKHEEADLILKLYDLRREGTMRKARDWYFRDFNPESKADVVNALFSEQSAYLRMVMSYWDMAAALVKHGAISIEFFNDTSGEHIGTFSKIEPFVEGIRAEFGPEFMASLEYLIDATPGGRERVAKSRDMMKAMSREIASRQGKAAAKAG